MKLVFPARRLGVIDRRVTAETCIDQCPTCGGVCTFRPLIRCVDNSTAQPFGAPLPCFVRPGDARMLSALVVEYGGSRPDVDGFWRVELVSPIQLVPFVGSPPREAFAGWGGTGVFRFHSVTGQTVEAPCCVHLLRSASQVRISSPCGFNPCPSDPRIPFRDGSAHPFHAMLATTAFGSARTGCQSLNAVNVPNLPTAILYRSGPGAGQQAGWNLNATATATGSLVACPTGQEFGACCFPDGSCSFGGASECSAAGGTYLGAGSGCDQCVQTGACCGIFPLPTGYETCRVITPGDCAAINGRYRGTGTACAGQPCPDWGRCCLSTGGCVVSNQPTCQVNGGVWTRGAVCSPGACAPPPVGACCLPDASRTCTQHTQAECLARSGTWRGAGFPCPPTGVCDGANLGFCCLSTDPRECYDITCEECATYATQRGVFYTCSPGMSCAQSGCLSGGRPIIVPGATGCAGCPQEGTAGGLVF